MDAMKNLNLMALCIVIATLNAITATFARGATHRNNLRRKENKMDLVDKCGSCHWWKYLGMFHTMGKGEEQKGLCKFNAPKVEITPEPDRGMWGPTMALWPETTVDDRCGQHKFSHDTHDKSWERINKAQDEELERQLKEADSK